MRHDLVSLRIFVTVAECGNLTRAAEREHLAVSAISKRIAELEELVRIPLLQRRPRGVGLTPAGQSLLRHARQLLSLVDRMDAELGEFADGVKGHVRLHAVASALSQSLPEEIESFLSGYPGVRVSLEEGTGKSVVTAVVDGSADLGVVSGHTPLPGLSALPYRTDRLMIGTPIGHPSARRRSVRFADALDYVSWGTACRQLDRAADGGRGACVWQVARAAGAGEQLRRDVPAGADAARDHAAARGRAGTSCHGGAYRDGAAERGLGRAADVHRAARPGAIQPHHVHADRASAARGWPRHRLRRSARVLQTRTMPWRDVAFRRRSLFLRGGGVDVMGRLLADKLRASLGQQVIVALAAVETQLEVELLREGGVMPSILKKAMVKETA